MGKQTGDDNRSNQMNPNNDAFWQARGFKKRPDDWKARMGNPRGFPVQAKAVPARSSRVKS